MSEWQPISTAPKDGRKFLAVNHDGELWVSRYTDDGRLSFRTHGRHEPRRFEIVNIGGEKLLREDEEYAKRNECWRDDWTLWSRLYEFAPTHWMKLPEAPGANP